MCVRVCLSLNVIKFKNNPVHVQLVGRRGQAKKERNKELLMNCQTLISRLRVNKEQDMDTERGAYIRIVSCRECE